MFTSYLEKSLDSVTFYPSSNYKDPLKYLEINDRPVGVPVIKEGPLSDASIRAWTETSVQKKGLRLLLAGRTGLSNLFERLPFSRETFLIIFDAFGLPSVYPAIIASKLPNYSYSASRNAAGDEVLSFVSRTFSFIKAAHALAVTYNATTKIVSAVIQGPKQLGYLSKLCNYLKDRSDLASHPAYILVTIAQLEFEATDEDYLPLRENMIRIEKWTGHGQLISSVRTESPFADGDLPAITRELNIFATQVRQQLERVQSCLLRHEQILQFMCRFDELSESNTDPRSEELRRHADFLKTGWKAMIHRYEAFEKNIQIQLAVLYNTSVQLDSRLNLDVAKSSASIAAASKRDGSVMKSISLLTMIFLPATFVSTLFAMPLFNWNADHISAVATPHAWIYLAVALPLTVAVVAVWSAWMWFNSTVRKHEGHGTVDGMEKQGLDDQVV